MKEFELLNLMNHRSGEQPQDGYLVFDVQDDNALDKLNKVIDVMRCIASFDEDDWPNDLTWIGVLPDWFSSKVLARDVKIILEDKSLWDFGSWLDAMKFRGWYWYSSLVEPNGFRIIVVPVTLPYSIDPLRFLIAESGIPDSSIEFFDRTV